MHFPEEAFVAHGHPESLITHEGSSAANTDVVRMMHKTINENMLKMLVNDEGYFCGTWFNGVDDGEKRNAGFSWMWLV